LTHNGLPVAGYKPQSTANVEQVNRNKETEERLLRLIETLKDTDADGRWLAVAKTHFEEGFMALNRAIFKPGRVTLPEDVPPVMDDDIPF
jgi:hypothetical protein